MKTLYLECGMGAAGDMLTAALLELIPDREAFLEKMNALGLPGVRVEAEKAVKCGITGTHMKVTVNGEEEESGDVADHVPGHEEEHSPGHDHPEHEHHEHGHEHEGGHGHEHPDHEHHHEHGHEHEDAHGHEHPDHEHHHEHEDDHGHEYHDHEHHHEHGHEHEDAHGHDHPGHGHHHASATEISSIIDGLEIPEKVRADAKAVYALIADAESRVHGQAVEQIHFHEVGTMDAVADVVGVCLLMEILHPDQVIASPIHVGCGYVRCMHGVLPVPAPATALILEGIPTYGGAIRGELCTPTGAALLKHFVTRFGERPVMITEAIGYGMGKKDFERANCVRAFLGECEEPREKIVKLECNLDDMTGEEIGFAMERLFAAGAREVYTQGIGMKKSRPGVVLNVICMPEDADRLAAEIMKHTTTLGIRRQGMDRYALRRSIETAQTPYGPVRVKKAGGMGVEKSKAEYEDLAALAVRAGVTLGEIRRSIR